MILRYLILRYLRVIHRLSKSCRWALAAGLAGALLAGCAGQRQPQLERYLPAAEPAARAVELAETPFFPQDAYQCGPAALATVLVASAVQITPDALTPQIYLPSRRGSLQPELIAAVRRQQRLPYVVPPDPRALLAEVGAGRPVLVMQNLGLSWLPVWHYAVVIGYDPVRDQVVLRSATTRRKVMASRFFLRSWSLAQNWALLVLKPDELPANPDPLPFLQAAAGLEATGNFAAALAAYQTALTRWPDDRHARLGEANSYLGLRQAGLAEDRYRQLLLIQADDPVALNNLAEALAAQGCVSEARETIATALALPQLPATLAPLLAQTAAELAARPDNSAVGGSCSRR